MNFNHEQINQALDDMYRVFGLLPVEAQEWFAQRTFELMQQRNNTSIYSVSSFKKIHELVLSYGFCVKNSSVLEIGAGKPLGMGLFWNRVGARKYTSIDKFIPVNLDDLWLARFKCILDMNILDTADFQITDCVRKDGKDYRLNQERIDLIQGDFGSHPLPLESFDLIYSIAVLEHVADIASILKRMCHLLRRDGLMIHIVDLREHHTHLKTVLDKNTSVDFLKYSKGDWEKLYPPGSEYYVNRLRASDYEAEFHKAGFEIVDLITTQEMDVNEGILGCLHPDFKGYAIDDLKKLGIIGILRKKAARER